MLEQNQYTEDNIRSLDWKEHIRMRPGMYIGKLGDGSSPDDGIYILLKRGDWTTVSMSSLWGPEKRLKLRLKINWLPFAIMVEEFL